MLCFLALNNVACFVWNPNKTPADVTGPVDIEIVHNIHFPKLDYYAVVFVYNT